MNRNQQAVNPRFLHAIIEDDLVLAASSDDSQVPSPAKQGDGEAARSLMSGFRIKQKKPLSDFHRSRQPVQHTELAGLDQAIDEIGYRATNGFAALLELPMRLAMGLKQ